jgi:hypothetical protein
MKRAPLLTCVGVAALACCAQAFGMTSTAKIQASVVEPAGIVVLTPLLLPTVTASAISSATSFGSVGTAGVAATGTNTSGATGASSTSGAPNTNVTTGSNATLTIHGQAGDAVSMAVPESFQVVRTGGTEALTVKTNTNAEFGLANDGVVLGGAVMGGSSMSVNVGGAISLASADNVAPGAYEGLLVVVVQYN